jgi:hypothetical protein
MATSDTTGVGNDRNSINDTLTHRDCDGSPVIEHGRSGFTVFLDYA